MIQSILNGQSLFCNQPIQDEDTLYADSSKSIVYFVRILEFVGCRKLLIIFSKKQNYNIHMILQKYSHLLTSALKPKIYLPAAYFSNNKPHPQPDLPKQSLQNKKDEGGQNSKFGLAARVYNKIVQNIQNEDVSTKGNYVQMGNFQKIMRNNRIWAKAIEEEQPGFFQSLSVIQQPEYLWIGCSDSRVPANQICGLKPGEVFVHRNIANQAPPSDINLLAVVQFSVQVLKVKDIIVTGHYGCGGIRAAFRMHDHGPLQAWLSHIRDLRWRYREQLNVLDQQKRQDTLCELNVKEQVSNIIRIPVVQQAWKKGQELRVHGLIYNLKDGLLNDLGITLSRMEDVPEEFRIMG